MRALARMPRAVSPSLRFHDNPRSLDLMQHLVVLMFSGTLAPWLFLIMGIPTIASALFVLGCVATSAAYSARRQQWRPGARVRLRAAQLALARDRESGLSAMRELVAAPADDVATEARGRLALDALTRGELAEAIELSRTSRYNPGLERQRRALGRGLLGELVRSLLAWISPDRFVRVAHSSAFRLDAHQREGASEDALEEFQALVAALRVLEATAAEPGARRVAWEATRRTELMTRLPAIGLLALAYVVQTTPALQGELDEALARASPAERALLERVFTRYRAQREELGDVYRAAPAELAPSESSRALALVAPVELIDAVAQPQVTEAIQRWRGATRLRAVMGPLLVIAAVLGGAYGSWPIALGVLLSYGLGIAGWQRWLWRARVRTLAELEPPPSRPWLAEFRHCPTSGIRGAGGDDIHPLSETQLALFVACVRADQALARGELEAAWDHVAWWFDVFKTGAYEPEPLYAVASCLLRVACLSGHDDEAERLAPVVRYLAGGDSDAHTRTCHGSAAGARAMTLALVAARRGQWDWAGRFLGDASIEPRVWQSPHVEALHGQLVRQARARGFTEHPAWARPSAARADAWTKWIGGFWPELLSDDE